MNERESTIGFAGLGKLGLPVALAIDAMDYDVVGYDPNPAIADYLDNKKIPYIEEDIEPLLESNRLELVDSVGELVARSSLIFVPIQTPHEKKYEGTTRLPDDRKDFNYEYLKQGIGDIAKAAKDLGKMTTVAVISTCLPGTFTKEIKPLLNEYVDYVYTPQFIAMGTTIHDYKNPEFVLCGTESGEPNETLRDFYYGFHNNEEKTFWTDITTAEGIKVFYNTMITAKTVLGNAMGEMAHKMGMDSDAIHEAMSLATDRILSPKYLKAGVGDGGGCHPRDNIALSYQAEKIGMSHNIWEDLMHAREDHMEWLGDVVVEEAEAAELPIIILGKSFKPETNIETGSPAILLRNLIKEKYKYCPAHVEDLIDPPRAAYIIATQHEKYKDYKFPEGSVIIDPFRYMPESAKVKLIRIGDGRTDNSKQTEAKHPTS